MAELPRRSMETFGNLYVFLLLEEKKNLWKYFGYMINIKEKCPFVFETTIIILTVSFCSLMRSLDCCFTAFCYFKY